MIIIRNYHKNVMYENAGSKDVEVLIYILLKWIILYMSIKHM